MSRRSGHEPEARTQRRREWRESRRERMLGGRYRVVPGSRNGQVETALEFWPVSCTILRNLLAGIWGSLLRFIETGFRT